MADDKIIYSMSSVSRSHDKRVVLKDISLSYFYGAKIGVLGLNGSGKSTLLRILAGEDTEFEGTTQAAPGFSIGYLNQEPLLRETRTVREVVEDGFGEIAALMREFDQINASFGEPMDDDAMTRLLERQADVQAELDAKQAWDIDQRVEMAMEALRCPPDDRCVDTLSGGERRRVALCRLLIAAPDILLLDEPTNHLDAETVAWLEQHLQRYEGTVIAVTHDRYFLDNVAGWILELDRGEGIPWKGNYSSWLEQKQSRQATQAKQEGKRQKAMARELEWIRRTPQGRQVRNQARISAYESMVEQDGKQRESQVEIYVPPGPRLGDVVIEAEQVSKSMGDTVLMDKVTVSAQATMNNFPSTECLRPDPTPESSPQHCPRNTGHASRQSPCLHTAEDAAPTTQPSQHQGDLSVHLAAECRARQSATGTTPLVDARHQTTCQHIDRQADTAALPSPSQRADRYPMPASHRVRPEHPPVAQAAASWHRHP